MGTTLKEILHCNSLFTTLWANSADDKLVIFFLYFSQKTGFDFSCKLSPKQDLAFQMSNPVFWGKCEKYFKMSSAEKNTPRVLRIKVLVFFMFRPIKTLPP